MVRLGLKQLAVMLAALFMVVLPGTAQAQISRTIKFTNECNHPIEFIIRNNKLGSGWASHGWYNLAANGSSTFSDGGVTLQQADGYDLYFYARATDGASETWTGDNTQSFNGQSYDFMKVNTATGSDGQLQARITCPGSSSVSGRVIKFTNECKHPIEFVVRNTPTGGSWSSHGWYNLKPWASSTFSDGGVTLTQDDDYSLYFYARATDGSGVEWSGDNRQSFQQATYPFMEVKTAVASDGKLIARITCP